MKKDSIKQNHNEERIAWSLSKKLTWDDFRGKKPNEFDSRKSETTTVILTDSTYYNDKNIPVYEIGCYFLPKLSWSITSESFALNHEQLHFDIAELFTRKIRKKFDSLNNIMIKDFKKYEVIFENLNYECEKYNILYDSEVYEVKDNDVVLFNFDKQEEWKDKIKNQLVELRDYAY